MLNFYNAARRNYLNNKKITARNNKFYVNNNKLIG